MTEQKPNITHLLAPNIPADRGLTGLGLLMQLGGSVLVAYGALIAVVSVLMPASPDSPRMTMFLLGIVSALRSSFHRSAGTNLLYGSPKGHLFGLKRYVLVGIVQSIVAFFLLKNMEMPTDVSLYLLVILLAWPTTLGLMMLLPQFKLGSSKLPHPEDMGFESLAVLMTIMGIAGSLIMGLVVYSMVSSEVMRSEVPGILAILLSGMLLVRSVFHAQAGMRGISGIDSDRAMATANRYVQFGTVSAIITGALFLLQMLMQSVHLASLVVAFGVSYLLLIWPNILRTFIGDRNFSLILNEETTPRRAPDTGLTALGWLLLALGSIGFATSAASLLISGNTQALEVAPLLTELTGAGPQSPLWALGIGALQLAAGFSLITMKSNHKLIVTVYGVVASLVTLYLAWPMIEFFKTSAPDPMMMPFVYGPLIMGLSVSIGAAFLVNRQESSDARARIVSE